MPHKLDQWAIQLIHEHGRLEDRYLTTASPELSESIRERQDTIEILLKDNYNLTLPKNLSNAN